MNSVAEEKAGLEAVRGLCRDLGDTEDQAEAVVAAERWVRAATGGGAKVVLARPDPAGRLRVVAWGSEPPTAGRLRSSRRRTAFQRRATVRMHGGSAAESVALLPLIVRADAIGVLEIEATDAALSAHWPTVEAISEQLALAIHHIDLRADEQRDLRTIERAAGLGRDLGRARTPEIAVRVAVRFLADAYRRPVGGWCLTGDGSMSLADVRGLGARKRRELRQALPTIEEWNGLPELRRADVKRRFAQIVGARRVMVVDAEGALLLAGDPTDEAETAFDVVGTLLSDVVRLLTSAIDAEQHTERLHMGVAWTAHELRGPILGLRAVLEVLLEHGLRDADRALLHRSLSEIDHLANASESMLEWAVEARQPERRPNDLVELVDAAVGAITLETGEDRIVVFAPPQLIVSIDPGYMRTAIVNLLRNAVAYSDPGTKVTVTIDASDDLVEIHVRNEGRAVPQVERQMIFGAFVRGTAANGSKGSGLGLFIASRVVRAHGGRIWADSDDEGVTFHLSLPGEPTIQGRWERRFVS
jgi:signal transduction histidine kinase